MLADEDKAELPVEAVDAGVSIKVPAEAPDKVNTVVVLEVERHA